MESTNKADESSVHQQESENIEQATECQSYFGMPTSSKKTSLLVSICVCIFLLTSIEVRR